MTETLKAIERLRDAVLKLYPPLVESAAKEILRVGVNPLEAIEKDPVQGIREVGRKFETGEFFLSELVMGAEAFKAGAAVLEPQLSEKDIVKKPTGVLYWVLLPVTFIRLGRILSQHC